MGLSDWAATVVSGRINDETARVTAEWVDAGGTTNRWQYDEAGNWLNAPGGQRWLYNADNELVARAQPDNTNWSATVTGQVDPGPNSNKWYNSWAECRGVSARVSTNDGTFALPNVPLHGGSNELVVTVTDVSGNRYTTNRWIRKDAPEYFLYDGNGNLTNWVCGTTNWVYKWDWADRLVKVTSNGVVVLENWYDAQSRRIAKAERVGGQIVRTLYLYDGWDIVAVMNAAGQMRETFTRGVGLAGDIGTLVAVTHHAGSWTNGVFYAQHNHRGDIVLTRSGTTTVGSYDYSAFGTMRSQIGPDVCRFKFSSKERDLSTGFSYYGYRFYAPQWQIWVCRDPLQERGDINLYKYVRNNPITLIDTDGQIAVGDIWNWLKNAGRYVGRVIYCLKVANDWMEENKQALPKNENYNDEDLAQYYSDFKDVWAKRCASSFRDVFKACMGATWFPPWGMGRL